LATAGHIDDAQACHPDAISIQSETTMLIWPAVHNRIRHSPNLRFDFGHRKCRMD
jgi:hypothetical protein